MNRMVFLFDCRQFDDGFDHNNKFAQNSLDREDIRHNGNVVYNGVFRKRAVLDKVDCRYFRVIANVAYYNESCSCFSHKDTLLKLDEGRVDIFPYDNAHYKHVHMQEFCRKHYHMYEEKSTDHILDSLLSHKSNNTCLGQTQMIFRILYYLLSSKAI